MINENDKEVAFKAWKENSFTIEFMKRLKEEEKHREQCILRPLVHDLWVYGNHSGVIATIHWILNIYGMSFQQLRSWRGINSSI